MRRQRGRKKARPMIRCHDAVEIRVLGAVLIVAGLVLLFLCIPGWAWAAMIGAALVMVGFWLISLGRY